MIGDVAFVFVCALAMGSLGLAFLAYTHPLVRWLAVLNLRYWRDHTLLGIPPSQSRIRWLEAAIENPGQAPEMVWLMRAMGAFALLLAALFIAGGVGRLM